ncbi:hypothetical protein Q5O14_08955 [Eubacteriaceae bacterium ES2]|nr:hypothetical protein Q5O14_08955 [Eubacteriaceae bacterium ES2]
MKVDGIQDINILFHQNTILDLSDMQTDYLNLYAGDFMKTVYLYTGTVNTTPYTDELLADQNFCQYYTFSTMLNGGVTISSENMKRHLKMDFSDYGASQETSLFSSEIKYANVH